MKKVLVWIWITVLMTVLVGCNQKAGHAQKIRDLDFAVLEKVDIPKELIKRIEDKKTYPFKISYCCDDFWYIAQGYGEQQGGGYSIKVNQLYEANNAVYFDISLIGASKDNESVEVRTYPYIVIKTKFIDKNIVFS